MKVLVVDDEMIIRVGIQSILERSGGIYTYAGSAGSGKAALKEMEKEMPDIVVTDIKMPEMDGIQLIKEIKRRVFLSAHQSSLFPVYCADAQVHPLWRYSSA